MIRYALRCAEGHEFESWFADSLAYDRQAKRGQIACPLCGSDKVEKAIMAPRVAPAKKRANARPKPDANPAAHGKLMSAKDSELRAKIRELHDYVTSHAENVGRQFPQQAREMHKGEIDHKPIYGQASPEETRALIEDGVEIMPLPTLPDDHN